MGYGPCGLVTTLITAQPRGSESPGRSLSQDPEQEPGGDSSSRAPLSGRLAAPVLLRPLLRVCCDWRLFEDRQASLESGAYPEYVGERVGVGGALRSALSS